MSKSRDFQPLIDLIKKLKPADPQELQRIATWKNQPFFEWNKKHESSDSEEEIDEKKQDYPLKRIRLITKKEVFTYEEEGLLDLTYSNTDNEEKNPRKQALYVRPELLKQIVQYFTESAMTLRQWGVFFGSNARKLDWSQLRTHYTDPVISDYQVIHRYMLKQFEIQLNKYLAAHPEVHSINLVDAGCGQAPQLLKEMYESAKKIIGSKQIVIKALGFDFEQSNIEVCNQNSHPVELKFIQGDANNIEEILQDPHLAKDALNILFSSGSMTRKTLNHAFEALHILKSNWRAHTQFLIAGGERELLFLERMIKRVGFVIKMHETISYEYKGTEFNEHQIRILPPILSLERITETEILRSFKKKLTYKDTLDLSLNPQADVFLAQIISEPGLSEKITTIDLSFSDIFDIGHLKKSLQSLPNLKKIIFYHNNSGLIKEMVQPFLSGVKLIAQYIQDELLLFGSKPFFQRMGGSQHLISSADHAYELVKKNDPEALKIFLDHSEVSLEQLCQINKNILIAAVDYECSSIFHLFQEEKVNLTAHLPFDLPQTLIHYAINTRKLSMIPVILAACPALINLSDCNGSTPLILATQSANAEILSTLLLQHPDLTIKDSSGNTAMHLAATDLNKIDIFQKSGFNFINGPLNKDNKTPFHYLLSLAFVDAKGPWNKVNTRLLPCIFTILLEDNSIDINNPIIQLENKEEPLSLKNKMMDLANAIVSEYRMMGIGTIPREHCYSLKAYDLYKELYDSFINLATKYHCDQALEILVTIDLYKTRGQQPRR